MENWAERTAGHDLREENNLEFQAAGDKAEERAVEESGRNEDFGATKENWAERTAGHDLREENHTESQVAGDKAEERDLVESDRNQDFAATMENLAERTAGHDSREENHPESQVVGDKVEERAVVESDKNQDFGATMENWAERTAGHDKSEENHSESRVVEDKVEEESDRNQDFAATMESRAEGTAGHDLREENHPESQATGDKVEERDVAESGRNQDFAATTENSAERTAGHDLREENHPESQVVGDKVEERALVDSDGNQDFAATVESLAERTAGPDLREENDPESQVVGDKAEERAVAESDRNPDFAATVKNWAERIAGRILREENHPESQVVEDKGEEIAVVDSDQNQDFAATTENSAETTIGRDLMEENLPKSRVLGDKAEERDIVESDRTVDNEDEVFEEAVEAPEPLMNQDMNSESREPAMSMVDDNLKVENELEDFEEAMDVTPVAPGTSEEKTDEKGKHSLDSANFDKIDEKGTDKQVAANEVSGGKEVSEFSSSEVNSKDGTEPFSMLSSSLISIKKVFGIGGTEAIKDEVEVDPSHEKEPSLGFSPELGENKVSEAEVDPSPEKEPSLGFSPELNGENKVSEVEVDPSHEKEPSLGFSPELKGENKVSEVGSHGGIEAFKDKVVELNPSHENEPSLGFSPELNGEKEVEVNPSHENETPTDFPAEVNEENEVSGVDINGDSRVSEVEGNLSPKIQPSAEILTPEIVEELKNQGDKVGALNKNPTKIYTEGQVIEKSREISISHVAIENQEPDLRSVDNNKGSSPTSPDEKVISVDKDSIMAKEHEKKVENTPQEKQTTNSPPVKLVPSPEKPKSTSSRPAGLGRAAPLLDPAPRPAQQHRPNGTPSNPQSHQIEDPVETEEHDETREKLQMIRVKFLRLAHRLGQTPHNVVVAQVLYRLGLAEQLRGRNGGRVGAFSFDRASAMAEQLESAGQSPLDFSCTIMVLGKTGVGKSATINSIFDEVKFGTDAFHLGTKKVQDVVGTVQGIRVRVIDTPGLLPSGSDQRQNEKILNSVNRFIRKTPPDIVLYLDRLDMQSRDFGDMPLLRTITEIFGPSIWFNAIVVLTHAASAPPDGPNGTASSYDMFVTQRSHVVQQAIRQAAGDMRLMNPVSLVENHSACRTNRAGQRVLPNGQVWKPHLLLLSFASKILAEANALLKLQDGPPGKPFAPRTRAPPLPFLLSSLLQSRAEVKLPEEQYGDDTNLDDDSDGSSDSDDDSDYDDLPPFRSLTKVQLAKLSKSQKKAYFDELEYREKLLMKKQLKDERRRRKMMKKMAAELPTENPEEEESGGASSVPVPMPDLALPASFDSDNPTHRYRYLDGSNQWLVRPVLETHGWDHDVGYEGVNVEKLFVVREKLPLSFSGQVTKDKKDANVQMEIASSIKHGKGKSTSLGFDVQTVGKDLVYTLRSETKFCNFRKNKASAGLSLTLLGDTLSGGLKIEDKLIANKRFQMVVSGGAMTGRGDVAYGGSLEAQLRDGDYPLGRFLSTLGLSVMDWHGDLAIGCNVQSQIPIGRSTNLIARGNLNNRGAGQISIRVNSSEQLQIALVGLIPLLKKVIGYYEQIQLG